MKLSPRVGPGAARIARGVGALIARLRASVWAPVALRIVAVAAGLSLLAVIGGSALAGGSAPSSPAAASAPFASAMPPPPDPAQWADAQAPPLSASAPVDPPREASGTPHGRATPDDPVVLNRASVDDLRRLPGIGAKRAESILQLRTRMGRFRQVEDLLKVKGIGRAMLKRIRPLVRIDGAAPEPG
jgi:competence protein ComEA